MEPSVPQHTIVGMVRELYRYPEGQLQRKLTVELMNHSSGVNHSSEPQQLRAQRGNLKELKQWVYSHSTCNSVPQKRKKNGVVSVKKQLREVTSVSEIVRYILQRQEV